MVLPTPDIHSRELTRIINTILLYAIRDEAVEIRIKHLIEAGNVCVAYLSRENGELCKEIPFPDSYYQPIVERLKEIAGEEEQIDVKIAGESYPFALLHERETNTDGAEVEMLILRLNCEPDAT